MDPAVPPSSALLPVVVTDQPAPMSSSARARRMLPFALLACSVFPIALWSGAARPALLPWAVVAFAATVALVVAVPWHRLPGSARMVPAATFALGIFLLREAGGGGTSGFGASLLLLPVVWEGVFGNRAALVRVLAVVGTSLVLPIVLVGAPRYTPSVEWPRAGLSILTWITVGLVLQNLVRNVRRNERVLAEVAGRARRLSIDGDARHSIAQAAREATGGLGAALFEVDGAGLRLTAIDGEVLAGGRYLDRTAMDEAEAAGEPFRISTSNPCIALDALRTGVTRFATDLAGPDPAEGRPHASVLHQPVRSGDRIVGILTVTWDRPRRAVSETDRHAVELLSHEVAVAIERADLVARLDRLAQTDTLTGLANRRAIDDHLDLELRRAARSGAPLAVAILDLDHFKAYNDSHGHQAGDQLLRSSAAAWSEVIRSTDLLGRWGGEEFAVVLANTDEPTARHILARLQDTTPSGATFSAGLVVAERGATAHELFAAADRALYAAKEAGRDRIVVAEAQPAGSTE